MKMKGALLAIVISALSMGAAAQQTMGADPERSWAEDEQPKTFTELDPNSDGVLTQDEVEQGNFSGDFDDLDRDGDGQVNRNEYYQYYREQST